ncbi:MAG: amino acid adenylation domain-containing protein, partial [Proteobacteria bacterium]|nr:amino acid adenylation domain-containing protein [Pseudomonadota bacterium]
AETVTVAACDVSDGGAVSALLDAIPTDHPLTGVFHLAGVLDDGVVTELTSERVARVLAPKVDGAWHLHTLTAAHDLSAFVLFSSAAGVMGGPGQANYAAANTFLDALAASRRQQGLAGQSLAWGLWEQQGVGMTAHLGAAELGRMSRQGLSPLSVSQGMALLDAAMAHPDATLVPVRMDLARMQRGLSESAAVPALLRRLLRPGLRRVGAAAVTATALRQRLSALPESEREAALVTLVQEEVSAVLGLAGAAAVPADRPLAELGLDSLMAVELRNRFRALLDAKVSLNGLFGNDSRAVAQLLVEGVGTPEQSPVAPPVALPDDPYAPFPLTPIQQAYWVGRQMGPAGGIAYHAYFEFQSPEVDLERLKASWQQVVARHEALRMVFTASGLQRVLPEVPGYSWPVDDLRALEEPDRQRRLMAVRSELSSAVRSLEQWPLFDFRVFLLPDGQTRLCLDFDLLCLDGASLQIVMRDWQRLYEDPDAPLPALPPRGFETVVRAGMAVRGTAPHQRAMAYWQERCPVFDPIPQLPLAKSPESVQNHHGVRYEGVLDAPDWAAVCAGASARGLTPSMVLCGVFAEVLSRWSSGAPFLLNLTHFTRPPVHPQVNEISGDFTNLLFLSCESGSGTALADRSSALQSQLHAHLEHSIVDGVEVLRSWRQMGREVMVPVVFTSTLGLPVSETMGWLGESVFSVTQTPQVWLDHIVLEEEGALHYSWDVIDALFPEGMISEMWSAYDARLRSLVDTPSAWEARWPELLPAPARERVASFNATAGPLSDQTLHGLFAVQARSQPDRPAVISAEQTLTYGALASMARQLGRRLRALGAQPNTLVALVMDKGWEQIVGALGILYSGAAYLPVDAGLPHSRRALLLERSGATVAVVQPGVEVAGLACVVVDRALLEEEEDTAFDFVQTSTDLAYVIYTSGSTGEPKGVMLDHRGPVNYLLDINTRLGVGPSDRSFGLSSMSFDLSVYDVFGLLAVGGGTVLPGASERADPSCWPAYLGRGVTVWNTVPALLQLLVEYAEGRPEVVSSMQGLARVMLSGDWIPVPLPDAFRALVSDAAMISVGGATETSINAIVYPIGEVEPSWPSIPWGRPMTNQEAWVLDAGLEVCPTYVPGELYIGGPCLAQGYWGDASLTSSRFIIHPRTGTRLYRTGDWGRWLPDGTLEFLGRRDQQVKVNGYRVELGEVESVLSSHPWVRQSVVVATGDRAKRLVGHVVLGAPPPPLLEGGSGWSDGAEVLLEDAASRAGFSSSLVESPGEGPPTVVFPALPVPSSDALPGALSLSLGGLGRLLECLRRVATPHAPFPKARYASPGSLYPVQVLVCVPSGQVAGLEGGVYYHHPLDHVLVQVAAAPPPQLGGACTVVLVGRLSAIAPIYGPVSEAFCQLEAGEVGHLLERAAVEQDLALGPQALVDREGLGEALGLEPGDVLLHALSVGAPPVLEDALVLAAASERNPQPAGEAFPVLA